VRSNHLKPSSPHVANDATLERGTDRVVASKQARLRSECVGYHGYLSEMLAKRQSSGFFGALEVEIVGVLVALAGLNHSSGIKSLVDAPPRAASVPRSDLP
jgi:hypothetical protein